ncbi:MAG TPA: cyclic nucleotide-binding domain-containing protein [Vicinamibacterales bacterium]|nr:cyclic nucleotide-binding domain-containing protein [Vicinamibacterales bacterium]
MIFQDARDYEDGEVIVTEGDSGADMFIVQTGRVAVTKTVGGRQVQLAILERGNFFGEMSLLESLPRSATVRAVGPARLVAIRTGELLLKIRRDPTFAFEMLQHMSGRIRHLDDQVTMLLQDKGVSSSEAGVAAAEIEFAAPARAGGAG